MYNCLRLILKRVTITLLFIEIIGALPSKAQTTDAALDALDTELLTRAATSSYLLSLPDYKRVSELSDKVLGREHRKSIKRAGTLASVLAIGGRFEEATPLYERVIRFRENDFKTKKEISEETVLEMNELADIYSILWRYADAERIFKRALAEREKIYGKMHPFVGISLDKLRLFYETTQRYSEMEPIIQRQLSIYRKHESDPIHQASVISAIDSLGDLYLELGRISEAEALFRQNASTLTKRDSSFIGYLSGNYAKLGKVATLKGNLTQAETYYNKAIEIDRGTKHAILSISSYLYSELAEVYYRQRRYPEAERAAKTAAERTKAQMGASDYVTSHVDGTLAKIYFAEKRYDEAEKLYKRVLGNQSKVAGSDGPGAASLFAELAELKLTLGNPSEGYDYAKRATSALIHRIRLRAEGMAMSSGGQIRPVSLFNQPAFATHLKAAAELASRFPDRSQALGVEIFEIAQWSQHSQVASALSQTTARFAQGEGELAQEVRRRQELTEQYRSAEKRLVEFLSKSDAERNSTREEGLRKNLADIESRIRTIDARLAKDFPQYAALASPSPLSVKEVQEQLRPGEALIMFDHDDERTYGWAVTREEARWKILPIGAQKLAVEVSALRCGLDESAWKNSERCRQLLGGKSPGDMGPPFDLARAHALYATLFQPFDDLIRDKSLLFPPTGPLAALPLQALATSAPDPSLTGAEQYARASWLGARQAVTTLPSVASLKSLRASTRKSSAPNPYAGFGNPLLLGASGNNRSAWSRQACDAAPQGGLRVASRAVVRSRTQDFFRGGLADVAAIKRQEPLPETADELCQAASALGASPDSVFLGARANESTLKSLSANGALKSWKILHFATHGLVAGETKYFSANRAEPALLLTPPDAPSEKNDGLLTASEVARLELDADWVILSACNTAAADGTPGAEALSGLASAFFYSGARSLAASHWYVNSEAAVKLMGDMFTELRNAPGLGKAEAMRRSIQARVREGGVRAHPSYWAPFVVVGDGT